VTILFVLFLSSLRTVSGSDPNPADPSLLPACTALYLNTDPSPNLYLCTYRKLLTQWSFSTQPPFLPLCFPSSFSSSSLPQFSTKVSVPGSAHFRGTNTFGPISFASATQSGSTRSAHEAPVFLPADQVLQVEFVPNMSDSSIWHENRASEVAFKH
jgi:hypothetical protein